MKLTKKLIKKLVMESLEESPVGGSPEVVSSMTTTNPMDNHGENGTFEELRDGSFRLMDKQGNEVTLSPEEMEKLVAQYEESKGYEGGHEAAEPEAPVQEISAALQEGRVTKSGLQKIIKEEYKKIIKEEESWRRQEKGDFYGKASKPTRAHPGLRSQFLELKGLLLGKFKELGGNYFKNFYLQGLDQKNPEYVDMNTIEKMEHILNTAQSAEDFK